MVVSGIAGPGFLLALLPVWMGHYAHPSAKDIMILCGSSIFKFIFPQKPQFCFYGKHERLIIRVADKIWISPSYLIGDIPLLPGDIPKH